MANLRSTCERKKGQSRVVVRISYAHIVIHMPTKHITHDAFFFFFFLHFKIVIPMRKWKFYPFVEKKKKNAFEIVQFNVALFSYCMLKLWFTHEKKANHLWGDPLDVWHYLISPCETIVAHIWKTPDYMWSSSAHMRNCSLTARFLIPHLYTNRQPTTLKLLSYTTSLFCQLRFYKKHTEQKALTQRAWGFASSVPRVYI